MSGRPRLLCVDDEPELLSSLRLTLRKQFDVTVAASGPEALRLFENLGRDGKAPFDVVLSDMRMPGMTGAELLTTLRARFPDVPRLLLSGQSDLDSAIAAINDAKIFRFLTKPCPSDVIAESLEDALESARLRRAEQELLDGTLNGAVGLLTEVLGLVNPGAYSRTMRISEIVKAVCKQIGVPVRWDLGLAATLSQIGYMVIPEAHGDGAPAGVDARHAEVAAGLVARIPRMESVADMIRMQADALPVGRGATPADWAEDDLYLEILRVSVHFDEFVAAGATSAVAVKTLAGSPAAPAPFLLDALSRVKPSWDAMVEFDAKVGEIAAGMKLTADVFAGDGTKLASEGTTLSSALIERILTFAESRGIVEPIPVLTPVAWLPKGR
jgi:CheY-like chemotaxis protein